MKLAVPKERRAHETRVAASPDTVKKFVAMGFEVAVEKGAGEGSAMIDAAYEKAGATIAKDMKTACADADVVLKVAPPIVDGRRNEVGMLKEGAILVSQLSARTDAELIGKLKEQKVTAFAMEMVPRITRAQSMDVLSSQANLAGYKAVIDAAEQFGRAFPMMMTAAGTVPPARVMVFGAGVAGLQAIATAKRLGAVVSATDVRPDTKEQVESLGGSFVAVDNEEFKAAQDAGGYAKEMSDDYKKQQAELIAETIKKQDIAICTAQIPGRKAPVLITEDMVKTMKPGAVIVDLAVESGGNCPLSEVGKVVEAHGVKIVGYANVPGRVAADASMLYAKNLLTFMDLLVDKENKKLAVPHDDDIIKGCLVTEGGEIVHPDLKPQ